MISLTITAGDHAGSEYSFPPESVISLGRSAEASVTLSDYHLSTDHAQIFAESQQFIYRDLRSTNGSRLRRNGDIIIIDGNRGWEISLRNGDEILLGDPEGPVVVQVALDAPDDNAIGDALIASRSLIDLPQVSSRIESDPQTGLKIFRALKPLSTRLEMDGTLAALAEACFELLPMATHISVYLRGELDEDRFSVALVRSRQPEESDEALKPSQAVLHKVLSDRAAILVANALEELDSSESIVAGKILSILAVPLWHGEKIRGVVQIDNRSSTGMFVEEQLEIAMVVASHATLALDNAALVEKLRVAEDKLQGENTYLKRQSAPVTFENIIGSAPKMKEVLAQLAKVVNTRATVCVEGETGTGKELIASAIHYQSNRRDKMFVAQNCAALPETLLESELFGHKKGAFTSADTDKKGLFDIADGGTLFLDEVGEMPLSLQAKLLRALQEGRIRPVGSTAEKQVDVRIVCATNRDLIAEVEAGNFRQDLYYRLMVFPIQLPPLRERASDIRELMDHFLKRYAKEYRREIAGFSKDAIAALTSYHWPGNIRELENEVQRLVIQVSDGAWIEASDLSPRLSKRKAGAHVGPREGTLKEMMAAVEKQILEEALADHDGNKTRTAQSLGITREGLHKKLAKYDMR